MVLSTHQNLYLVSLCQCHLVASISEKRIKNTTEKCTLGKQAIFFFSKDVRKLRSLRFVDYVII